MARVVCAKRSCKAAVTGATGMSAHSEAMERGWLAGFTKDGKAYCPKHRGLHS